MDGWYCFNALLDQEGKVKVPIADHADGRRSEEKEFCMQAK
jgi:hypothetical protein